MVEASLTSLLSASPPKKEKKPCQSEEKKLPIVFLSAVGVLFGTMGSPVFERAIRGSRGLMYESSFRIPGNELRMTNTELRTGSGTEKRGDGKGVGRERRVNKAAPITIETTEKKYLFPREYIGIL